MLDENAIPISRRMLHDQLRYLANKLQEGYDPAHVSFVLQIIADEQEEAVNGKDNGTET